jgi:hypothetical protein
MGYNVFLKVANEYDKPLVKYSVIRKLKEEDKDPDKPADDQQWGLYSSDGSKLLGRHPSKEKALEQEQAIKAKGGSVFREIYQRYAQTVDPTQLQIGESVYDDTGAEHVVVENDPTKTNVVLMPADQAQQAVPEGVTTVEETDLGSYTVQPTGGQTSARRTATEVDWADIQSAATDVLAYVKGKDLSGLVEALDYLNFLLLGQLELPEDADIGTMFEQAGRRNSQVGVFAEFDKDIEMEVEDLDDLNEVDVSTPGESGYTEIIQDVKNMIADGVPVVDLILAVGEKYPRSIGEKVLADARSRGIL